jgi:glutamine synthetase
VRFPDPTANPYLAFAAMLMAGSTASRTRSTPAIRHGQGSLRPAAGRARKAIPTVCLEPEMALDALDADRGFLTAGGVFTDDMIDGYIEARMTTHPVEFDMR